jgi:hypothetical protein
MFVFIKRLLGAARLDARTYEDVEADVGATGQAVVVVLASSLAAAVGLAPVATLDLPLFVTHLTGALMAWVVWATLVYLIGVHLLPTAETRATVGEVLRTTGFAATPGVLRVFGGVPFIGVPIWLLTTAWMLIAMFVAVRQALDYRQFTRALAVCLVGWLLSLVFVAIIGFAFAPTVR